MRRRAQLALQAATLALAAMLCAPARADLLRQCAAPPAVTAAQADRQFRFAALVRAELAASGAPLAVVARAGTDLTRFGLQHSHAGISLRDSPNTPWSVRQLYFDCAESRPRLFDQGLPGFVRGGADPDAGDLVVWLLPDDAAAALARAALDDRRALALLGDAYSANAHAWSTRYQNCNQWVAELLAAAWGDMPAGGTDAAAAAGAGAEGGAVDRQAAQRWLQAQGYVPTRVEVRNPLLLLAGTLVPWLHVDDHPPDAMGRGVFDVSLPASIEAFLRQRVPGTRRLRLCHDAQQMVVQSGWDDRPPSAGGCSAAVGDRVIRFDAAPAAVPGA